MTLLLFIAGGALLIGGAEALVRGASRLAFIIGISPLVVGLTVVAFGTSAPELAVTIRAVLAGTADIAVGNVVGSNVFNVLVVIGLSALIAPLVVHQRLVRLDVPLMIFASIVVMLMALDGRISRIEGIVLFLGLAAYLTFLIGHARTETAAARGELEAFGERMETVRPWRSIFLVLLGLVLLALGSRWLVDASVAFAAALGVSELVVGLTIVAAGTSLPEVATSVLASIRGERDIAVGNAIGSNLFNLLAVLGIGSALAPEGIPVSRGALTFDLPVMTVVAIATLPVFFTGYRIARWEGLVFVAYYVAYVVYLVLDATQHDALNEFRAAMALFVIPITVLTLVVVGVQSRRARPRQQASGRALP